MKQSDNIASLLLAIYLIAVAIRGNGQQLADLLAGQAGFVRWGAAFLVVVFVVENYKLGAAGNMLIVLLLVAMALSAASSESGGLQTAADEFNKVFQGE